MQLFHDDCLNVLKTLPDNSVDLVLTDPPYKMTKMGKSCRPNYMRNNMGENLFDGDLPVTKQWMQECYRVMKPQSHIYVFTNVVSLQDYLNTAIEVGFKLHNVITMIKDTGMPNRWYYKQCELVLFLRKGKAKPINDYTSRDNIKVTMPKKRDGKIHVTQKPLSICETFVLNSTEEGEVVLDPFMGSGTTGVAALKNNRDFIGIEMHEDHYRNASIRLENVEKDLIGLFE